MTCIEPKSGWELLNLKELTQYRDLLSFLVWRDIKVVYAQTILGFLWAILQPLIQIIIFATIFGTVAQVSTGDIPYMLFMTVAIIPWTYMSQAMTDSSQSLLNSQHILGKIYFPRLFFPLTPVLAKGVDFVISMVIVVVLLVYYHVRPTWNILLFPIFVMVMICICAGTGMWLSALTVRFRDVKHAMPFVNRMLMYTAPIVYPISSIPGKYRFLYSLNPLVAVIEGCRASLLGMAMPWPYIWPGIATSAILCISGALYFKRTERIFADVI
jgi:lipopolysaccharide transport system permease protein